MAATLDIVSGGPLELGIGAGWNEEESGAYGIELGGPAERSDRFEEACEVIVSLLTRQTTDFSGQYYQLTSARVSQNRCNSRTRRLSSAAAGSGVRREPPPGLPSTGTSSAGRLRSSPASVMFFMPTATTLGATRRRSCCPAMFGSARTARSDRPSTPWPRSATWAWTWRSSSSPPQTPPCSPAGRCPGPTPLTPDPRSSRPHTAARPQLEHPGVPGDPDIFRNFDQCAQIGNSSEECPKTRTPLKSLTRRDNCQMMCTQALLWTSAVNTCNLCRGSDRIARSN